MYWTNLLRCINILIYRRTFLIEKRVGNNQDNLWNAKSFMDKQTSYSFRLWCEKRKGMKKTGLIVKFQALISIPKSTICHGSGEFSKSNEIQKLLMKKWTELTCPVSDDLNRSNNLEFLSATVLYFKSPKVSFKLWSHASIPLLWPLYVLPPIQTFPTCRKDWRKGNMNTRNQHLSL